MSGFHSRKSQFFKVIWTIIALLILSTIDPVPHVFAGNDTWTNLGLLGVPIYSIAINPSNPQELLVALGNNNSSHIIYRSEDGGSTWTPSSSGISASVSFCLHIAYAMDNNNIVYASTSAGVYKSLDGGLSWQQVGSLTYADALAVNPINANIVYASTMSNLGDSIWMSTDGGNTWGSVLGPTTSNFGIHEVLIAPSDPHVLYAGGDETGLYKSVDSGQTWTHAEGGFLSIPIVSALAIDPYSSNIVYMADHNTLYKTNDGGNSWTPIAAGLGGTAIFSIVVDPSNQQIIYVGILSGGTLGVYRSTDSSGTSWVQMSSGMGSISIQSLAIDNSSPQSLYAGSNSTGVWKYTFATSSPPDYSVSINNGALFTNQTNVTLNLTAPPGTTQMMISNDGGFSGASWEAFSNSKAWTITNYGSYVIPRTVYAKFQTYGQISGLYQDDIILDVTPPTGTVQITSVLSPARSSGQQSAHLSSGPLTPVSVGLQLNATDDVSGVSQMIISNQSNFSGAAWDPYQASKTWQTDTTGTVTAYVKFQDYAGNVSSIVCATNGTTPCTGTFGDVFPDYWAYSWIERLYNAGITGGCSVTPLNYCPDSNVTRDQMAVFLERGMHTSSFTPPTVPLTFTDTTGNFAQYWIEALKSDGITSGCGLGIYCPSSPTTRAQMAVFLLKSEHGVGYTPPPATGTKFTDVLANYWASSWIEQLANEGITSGCGTNLYCPDQSVTRAQMAVFLVKTFGLP